MRPSEIFGRAVAGAIRHPRLTLLLTLILVVAATLAATRLPTEAGTSTLVDEDSSEFQATERFRDRFGDDAVVILVEGDLRELALTRNLATLLELEGCLAGGTEISRQLPRRRQPLPPECNQLAELAPSRVVYGPATFLFASVSQISQVLQSQIGSAQQAAERASQQAAKQGLSESEQQEAAQAVLQGFQSELLRLGLRYGLRGVPRLDDPNFIARVIFDPERPGEPKSRLSYLFPSRSAALISVRLRPELSDAERREAIGLIRAITEDERFALLGGSYVVSGVPDVVEDLADSLRSELFLLLGAAIVVMALTLAAILAPPLRLLPLAVALAAAGLTFGLLSLTGGSLTMASIAVLPVLIGLAVDYAIQFQARFAESRADGADPAAAAIAAAGRGGAVIGTACIATAAGLAVLALSPVPMVRSFGLLLVAGIVLAFAVAITAGLAALALAARPRRWRRRPRILAPLRRVAARIGSWRDRGAARLRAWGKAALAVSISNPGRVLAAGVVLAVTGWIASTQTEVVSDLRELGPEDSPSLQRINALQEATGVSGELNVTVRADEITDAEVINWMRSFQTRVLERHGYSGENPDCAEADLCPGIPLTEFFGNVSGPQAQEQVEALLAAIPPYFSQAVISRDPETGEIGDTANIAFGIPVQPLEDQQELIEDVRSQIDPADGEGPPEGVEVELAGLPVLAAEANSDLAASRFWLPLVALAAVALALLALYRSVRRALVPLVPIVLATGWSALVVAAMEIPLNPMSATLGALVIAIATEFSVILSARYEGERRGGHSVGEALRRTYSRTGTAVLASGVTAVAGFAVLALTGIPGLEEVGLTSDIRMLRDFGLVTVVDLAVALAGVMLVLPAVLVIGEQRLSPRARRAARPAPAPAGSRP